ncbi:GGDEF domain-containing protein [Magnetovirga frankeli]|uniref:GGDEF domain-containing protein n=1 Tax=Magnetovirga frankeli TaxID=947516 RepID=UPI003D352A76
MSPNQSYTEERICPMGAEDCPQIDRLRHCLSQLALLETQVRTDPLTGLYNFRHFAESLDNEMERTRRSLQPTALILVDLDFFKRVNDEHGHEVGNLALKQTAQQIQTHLRKLDIGCRYGGEEFALILPNTQLEKAMEVAERLRQLREQEPVPLPDGEGLPLTASYGVAVFTGGEFISRQEFTAHADHYLYKAKDAGRNRVCAPTPKRPADTEVSADEKRLLLG